MQRIFITDCIFFDKGEVLPGGTELDNLLLTMSEVVFYFSSSAALHDYLPQALANHQREPLVSMVEKEPLQSCATCLYSARLKRVKNGHRDRLGLKRVK